MITIIKVNGYINNKKVDLRAKNITMDKESFHDQGVNSPSKGNNLKCLFVNFPSEGNNPKCLFHFTMELKNR